MTAGASILKNADPFRATSIRLLSDLLELARASGNQKLLELDEATELRGASFIVVLQGALRLRAPAGRRRPRRKAELRRGAPPRDEVDTIVQEGEVFSTDPIGAEARLRIVATDPEGALFVTLPMHTLERAANGSFVFARRLEQLIGPSGRAHTIWVSTDAGLDCPLEALTQLLAAAIATQFEEQTATITFAAGNVTLRLWQKDQFVRVPFVPPDPATDDDIVQALDQFLGGPPPFYHLVFVNLSNARNVPAPFAAQQFHRIVYVTTSVPSAVPTDLTERFKPGAQNPANPSDIYFSSFIPSLPVRPAPRDGTAPAAAPPVPSFVRSLWRAALRRLTEPDRFQSEELHDDVDESAGIVPMAPSARLRRDLCRLALDQDALRRLWDTWPLTVPSFAAAALAPGQGFKHTAERWARAVTSRRVGLAVSGGGAASYRVVPLIRALHRGKVPIDVVSAISGGALLGAYYCRHGLDGLRRYINRGRLYYALNYLAVLSPWLLESAVDWDTGPDDIDQLEVRFVPLTTALPKNSPPLASAVVRGTLGEGVRASGAAPGFYARTQKRGVIYSDGSSASPLPARAAGEFGADLILACNAIPGPDRRNPLSDLPGGEFVFSCTPLGRLLDAWVAGAFLLERISQQAARDAHAFVEATPVGTPLVDCVRFDRAKEFVCIATNDERVQRGAAKCVNEWQKFKVL